MATTEKLELSVSNSDKRIRITEVNAKIDKNNIESVKALSMVLNLECINHSDFYAIKTSAKDKLLELIKTF